MTTLLRELVHSKLSRLAQVSSLLEFVKYSEDTDFVYVIVRRNWKWTIQSQEYRRIRDAVQDLGGSFISYGRSNLEDLARFSLPKVKVRGWDYL